MFSLFQRKPEVNPFAAKPEAKPEAKVYRGKTNQEIISAIAYQVFHHNIHIVADLQPFYLSLWDKKCEVKTITRSVPYGVFDSAALHDAVVEIMGEFRENVIGKRYNGRDHSPKSDSYASIMDERSGFGVTFEITNDFTVVLTTKYIVA